MQEIIYAPRRLRTCSEYIAELESAMPDDLIARIDALVAKVPKEPWHVHEGTGGIYAGDLYLATTVGDNEADISALIVALINSWPQLRALALAGMAVREDETIIGRHSGESAHREWWSGGTWLYPGDVVIERGTTPERGKP